VNGDPADPARAAAAASIKAQPFKSLLKFLEADLTFEQREAAVAGLPAQYRAYTQKVILASDWLPLEAINLLTEAAARAKGEPLDSFAHRAGRFAADEAVHTIYKWLAFLKTPDYVLSKASRTWTTFYNRGAMNVERIADRHARVLLSDFPSHPAGCGRVTGWMQQLGEMTKAPNIKVVHTACRSKGARNCEWSVTWE
jgi:hypothetical protein